MHVASSTMAGSRPLQEIYDALGIHYAKGGVEVYTAHIEDLHGVEVKKAGNRICIRYSEPAFLYRGVGLAVENSHLDRFTLLETPRFSTNGLMLDCSRNAVASLPTLKTLIRQLALMGHNTLMLYTEDTYTVEGQPYFGYMRGRYTETELRELDEYASSFGIELVPCIQTLAHLQSALQWDAYRDIRDIDDILLADDERTYALIADMIGACRRLFRSRRIHIGMDEAVHLGRGRYRDIHGPADSFSLMCRHLDKVCAICRENGFTPMMWSDMFFHLVGGGYNTEEAIPPEKLQLVPEGVELVYWDYYATSQEVYDANCKKHLRFPNPVLFAGGAWKWTGYAPSLEHSLRVSRMALSACADNGIGQVFATAWGDNGGETSLLAILPVLQLFAEVNFHGEVTDEQLAKRLKTCTGAALEAFRLLEAPNVPLTDSRAMGLNACKYLLFQDVLCGLFDKHVQPGYNAYYAETAERLATAGAAAGAYAYLFDTLAALCRVLSLKSEIGLQLKAAYDAGDKAALARLARETLPAVTAAAEDFRRALETQWMRENKPFGFEVQDIRVGGMIQRCKTAAARVAAYAEGSLPRLEELEEERLYFDCRTEDGSPDPISCNIWTRIATAGLL